MIYKINNRTGEITQIPDSDGRYALESYGWSANIISEFFRSAKVLYTPTAHYSRFKNRLEELLDELKPTMPSPYGTKDVYDLEYHNSTRRVKILREKNWLENSTKHLRPLILHRPEEKGKATVNFTSENNVTFTLYNGNESVNFTPENASKSVKITPNKCNFYTKNGSNSVNFTPENAAISKEISDSDDAKTFKDLKSDLRFTTTTKNTGVVVVKNGHKSQFSFEEIQAYVLICEKSGQVIKNSFGLVTHLYETGESDAIILAKLYPEQITPEQTVEYDDPLDGLLNHKQFDDALKVPVETQSEGFDTSDWERFYAPRDWARLNEDAKNYK